MENHHEATIVNVPRPQAPGAAAMQAYFVRPPGAGPHPGLVIIHEAFGLNDNIRDVARRGAGEGYAALAVDLFSTGHRVVCLARAFYGMLIQPLKNGTVADLQAAIDYLRARPEVDAARVGAIGFCMGGGYALQLACVGQGLKAASVFYGMNPRPLEALARACPVVGSYPEKDFTASMAQKLEPALEQYHVPHDIRIYPGARHSFFNDRGAAYDATAAADAWRRTMAFFETHLGTK